MGKTGALAVGTDEGHVLVWNPAWRRHRLIEVGRNDCPVRAVAVMLDGRVVSAGDDGQVLGVGAVAFANCTGTSR